MTTKTIVVQNTTKKPQKLTLRLKSVHKKKMVYLFSWNGFEEKRALLQALAKEAVEAEKKVQAIAVANGWNAIGLVSSAIRDPSSVSYCP
jgi:hypothetical protein